MLALTIARDGIESGRQIGAAERPIVANIRPQSSLNRLPLDQERHRRVVAVDPLRCQHAGADELGERSQDSSAGTDMVGER